VINRIPARLQHGADTFEVVKMVDVSIVAVVDSQRAIPQDIEAAYARRKNYRVRHDFSIQEVIVSQPR
jgi:hypothetical protein